jgi:hypothetical protein
MGATSNEVKVGGAAGLAVQSNFIAASLSLAACGVYPCIGGQYLTLGCCCDTALATMKGRVVLFDTLGFVVGVSQQVTFTADANPMLEPAGPYTGSFVTSGGYLCTPSMSTVFNLAGAASFTFVVDAVSNTSGETFALCGRWFAPLGLLQ